MAIQRLSKVIGFVLVVLLLTTTDAEAQQKLGDVITNTMKSIQTLPNLLSLVAYLSGSFFAVWGIFKFKDHVDNPSQNPLSAGVKRFLAGGMFLALPAMAKALKGTFFAGGGPGISTTTPSHMSLASGSGMDKMIVDFVSNTYGPMSMLLQVFTYIAAIILLLTAISRLIKTAQDGPRGPTGLGTIMTFLVAGALFSFGDMMGSFSSSLFGDANVSVNANIGATVISDQADRDKVAAVIEAVMLFIMIVGAIAFIRGLFVLRAFADGSTNATLAQGLTFLIGGVLAINLGELVNVLQATVGINPLSGLSFG